MDQTPKLKGAKVQHLAVDLADVDFKRTLFFNRFGIESAETHMLVHFGYVARTGEVLSSYSTAMPKAFLDANHEEWVEYLGKVGQPPEHVLDVSWRPPVGQCGSVEVTNAMRVGRLGADAELRFYSVSIVSIIDKQREGTTVSKPLQAQPLAFLQSSLEQQQLLLLALIKHQNL